MFRLSAAGDFKRIGGEQRKERVGSVVAKLLGKSEQALIEAGMFVFAFLRGATAIHARQRHDERERDGTADPEEKHEAAQQQAGGRKRRSHEGCHDGQRKKQSGARDSSRAAAPGHKPETALQTIEILSKAFEGTHAASLPAPAVMCRLPKTDSATASIASNTSTHHHNSALSSRLSAALDEPTSC